MKVYCVKCASNIPKEYEMKERTSLYGHKRFRCPSCHIEVVVE